MKIFRLSDHFGKKIHIILFFLSRFAPQLIGSPVRFFVFFIQKYPGAFIPAIRLLVFLHLGAGVVLTVCLYMVCTCIRPPMYPCFRLVMYLLGTCWRLANTMFFLFGLVAHGLSQKHNVIYRQICGVVLHVGGTFIRQYQRIFYFVVGISNESIKRAMG